MSFRLGKHGLERRHPYWYGKKPPEEHEDASGPTTTTHSQSSVEKGTVPQDIHPGVCAEGLDLNQDEADGLLRLSTSPLLLFGTARIDVFGVLPVRLSPWDEELLGRFSQMEKWPWCPINVQSLWAPLALSDELVFHVTMFSWATAFMRRIFGPAAKSRVRDYAGIIQHKLSTIHLINTRISDPVQTVQDETIAAVAAMTSIEIMSGTPDDAMKHMDGLRRLVSMRGGFSQFSTPIQLLIQRLLSWTDLVYSELFRTRLSFPPAEVWDVSWKALEKSSLLRSPVGASPVELRAAGIPYGEMMDIWQSIRQLCHAEEVRPLRTLGDYKRMQRGDMFHRTERRLMVTVQDTSSPSQGPWTANVWRASALAALLFVHHFLRCNPPTHRQFGVLVPQLQETLLRLDCSLQKLAFASSLLLFVLSVGAVTGSATPCYSWFIDKLAEACELSSLDWPGLQALLARFLWTGPADEARYFAVWQSVVAPVGVKILRTP